MQTPRHDALRAPAFVRDVAHLGQATPLAPGQALTETLAGWLDWKQAVALATALETSPAATAAGDEPAALAPGLDLDRVRASLEAAIARDPALRAGPAETADYAFVHRRYLALQQAMESAIAQLRARLRTQLASAGPVLARLAAVDAVLEQTLLRPERRALHAVPALLAQRHASLCPAAHPLPAPEGADDSPAPAWLATFRGELHRTLLAELDVRLHPVLGLLAAFHAHGHPSDAQTA